VDAFPCELLESGEPKGGIQATVMAARSSSPVDRSRGFSWWRS
jgi:hypothetical protein